MNENKKKTLFVAAGLLLILSTGIVLELLLVDEKETTVYSQLYKESSFMLISKGMSRQEVIDKLGLPLSIHTIRDKGERGEILDDKSAVEMYINSVKEGDHMSTTDDGQKEYWSFSSQKTTTSDYYVRIIVFNNKGTVIDKISEIYVD